MLKYTGGKGRAPAAYFLKVREEQGRCSKTLTSGNHRETKQRGVYYCFSDMHGTHAFNDQGKHSGGRAGRFQLKASQGYTARVP